MNPVFAIRKLVKPQTSLGDKHSTIGTPNPIVPADNPHFAIDRFPCLMTMRYF